MTRLRVLHTVGNLELGGGQKLVALVAGALDPVRFEVAVLSFESGGPYAERLRSRGIPVHELGLRRPLRRNRPRTIARAIRVLVGTVVRGRWDVVHTHMFTSALVVTPLARLGRARAMGTTHRVYYGRLQTIAERALSVLQERIVVDSAAVGEILRAETHIRADKYVVIHNGIDPAELDAAPARAEARRGLGLPADALVVGEVAHLALHKGQRHLIGAVGRLVADHPDLHLVLVGAGPDRAALEAQVAALGLSMRVHLLGARGDLPTVLAALDVLALPSTFEGFGIVQAEAMYLGLPVVATDHGGSTEVVDEGITGYLVPFGDEAALTDRLGRLVEDAGLRARMGEAGRDRVLARFTSERMGDAYARLYL